MQRAWWRGSRARPPRGLRIRVPNLAQARGGGGGGRDVEGGDRRWGTLGLGLVEGAGEAGGGCEGGGGGVVSKGNGDVGRMARRGLSAKNVDDKFE